MRRKSKYFILVLMTLVLITVLGTIALGAYADIDNGTICKGVFIDDLDVGGMNKEQAESAINDYIASLEAKKVTIKVGDKKVEGTMKDLGFSTVANEYVEDALAAGKSGNLIKRYKELRDIENDKLVFNLEYTVDEAKVQSFLEKCKEFDQEAKNATITKNGDSFSVTDSQTGIGTDMEATGNLLTAAVNTDWDKQDVNIDAVITTLEPTITKEKALLCRDLLGSATTYYSDSTYNRATNISNGARLISGSVVAPGETFSAYEHFAPFTAGNGWREGGAYENGQVVQSIGGGVCQVSTTMYNALLWAEMEIVDRSNHSMIVGYVKPAFDAAVAGSTTAAYKDLKFKNNTDVPVYIEAYTKGKSITFNIYGQETRPSNRKIEYVNDIVNVIKPGEDVVTEDDTKDEDYEEVTQTAHTGYQAYLYKIVYIDGKQVSKTEVNFSKYRSSPKYVTKGTKPVETETPKPSKKPNKKPTPTPDPVDPGVPVDPVDPGVPVDPVVPVDPTPAPVDPTPVNPAPTTPPVESGAVTP